MLLFQAYIHKIQHNIVPFLVSDKKKVCDFTDLIVQVCN